jgi:hypothetical protein
MALVVVEVALVLLHPQKNTFLLPMENIVCFAEVKKNVALATEFMFVEVILAQYHLLKNIS